MISNSELFARRERAVPRGVYNALPVFPDRALGGEIWDVEGRRWIDLAGGIGVLNVGHSHPRVVAAAEEQLRRYAHPCFQVMPYEPYVRLAERLGELAPITGNTKALFLTTGAEAVENAVKIARAHTRRSAVVAFAGAFHGRTLYTLAMTGKVAPYKAGFGPLPGEVYHAPYPMEYRGVTTEDALAGLQRIFKTDVGPEQVAAIIIEPVQGEGGFYAAPAPFLEALRAICDEHDIVLIADEIQCGFGRTGRMFAMEHSGVEPDLMTVAKSLAGGLPLSGVVGRAEVMDAPAPGGLGGTYGGNAVSCAAALAVLDVFEEEGLLQRATTLGERALARLRRAAERPELACIGDVRGLGAMCAIELVKDRTTREPNPMRTKATVAKARELGLVLLSCGLHGNVLRLLFPLTVSDELLDEGLDLLERCLVESAA